MYTDNPLNDAQDYLRDLDSCPIDYPYSCAECGCGFFVGGEVDDFKFCDECLKPPYSYINTLKDSGLPSNLIYSLKINQL